MTGQPVYSFLEDFGSVEVSARPTVVNSRPEAASAPARADLTVERLQEAYTQGRSAAEADMHEQKQREMEVHSADCERRIREVEIALSDVIAQELAQSLRHSLEELATTLSKDIYSILLPMVVGRLVDEGVKQMADDIKSVFVSGRALSFAVNGPDELVEKLVNRLQSGVDWPKEEQPEVLLSPEGGPELRVSYDRSVIETRLGEWLESVKKVAS